MAFFEDAIISSFIGKVIGDSIDVSWNRIKEADKNRKAKKQNLQMRLYQIIIDIINECTNQKYKDQGILYDAAEDILNGLKNKVDNIEAIRNGLQVLYPNIGEDKCKGFIRQLFNELSKEANFDIYKEICILRSERESKYIDDKLEYIIKELIEVIEKSDRKCMENKKNQNNKKEDYLKNWGGRLFLHFDDDDKTFTLEKTFIMPDIIVSKEIRRIGFSTDDTLDKRLFKFIEYDNTCTMLITGVPGMGKSSIVSWIANEYKNDDRIIILRFRDLTRVSLEEGLLSAVCKELSYESKDLENKVLILDGFDEMKALDIREKLLNDFFNNLKDFENLKCIITSRPAYIDASRFQNVFTLRNLIERKWNDFITI